MTDATPPSERGFDIRPATADDAAVLAHVGGRLFEETFGAANDPAGMAAYLRKAFSVEHEAALLADPMRAIWIAESADRAIGYAVVRRHSRSDGIVARAPAEVERLYAERAWHGRGVGDALMGACRAQAIAWHSDMLWLGVWEKNPRAIAFYEKQGFRVVGRQVFQLGRDRQNDLVMAVSLS